jgi:RimJ/RimL family protein N-acetyltransferase
MATEQPKTVKVRTTLPVTPFPTSSERPQIKTERLILRPLCQDDLHGLHSIRSEPEVMFYTPAGRPDKDLAETQAKLDLFLPPQDAVRYNLAIHLASTGEMIGVGGMHRLTSDAGGFTWPEMGYLFKKAHWGQGYGTEAMKAFIDTWWKLPRKEVEVEADALTVDSPGQVPERLMAVIESGNTGSRRVLEKLGFRRYTEWNEPDSRAGFEGMEVTLVGFILPMETAGVL